MKQANVTALFINICLFTACHNADPDTSMQTTDRYKEGFVESEQVKLHYIDWGGQGEALILICGLGDTPYLFESLAKELSHDYRVIGYTRRYHGKSVAVGKKYDNATLVADLKLLVDSLKIDKVNLLGWSMGGNEVTEFASCYPERVGKLIYFEAGYDLSDGGFAKLLSNIPEYYLPDKNVMGSLDKYREWYQHFWFGDMKWNHALEANLQASVQVQSDGRVKTIPDDSVFKLILKEAMNYHRRYGSVQAPSLVIYTKPFFHPADDKPATTKLYEKLEGSIVTPWRVANKKRIEKELRNTKIVEAPYGTHTSFLFLSSDFLVNTIRSFLLEKS